MPNALAFLLIGGLSAAAAPAVRAEGRSSAPAPPSLALSYAHALQDVDQGGDRSSRRKSMGAESIEIPGNRPEFGEAGYLSWAVGVGAGTGSNDVDAAANGFVAIEWFIADRFQFTTELSGWYFNQEEDAGAANLNFMFKYHFIERRDYTVFVSAGAGLFAATEEVPRDGTPLNFSPRAGVGFTYRLNDHGLRLLGGLRWQHFSNASVGGSDDNPGTDLIHAYIGLSFPF